MKNFHWIKLLICNLLLLLFAFNFQIFNLFLLLSNLSNNKFKALKLEDGFEDLINLETLDFTANNQLRSLSARNFLKKFRHLKKM
jgi:hypothetical protein